MISRLFSNWVYGGFLAAFLLLGLLPVFSRTWSLSFVFVFLQLPIYMLHQLEEHDDDRFRSFVNHVLGRGRELLTKTAVFVVNVPGVWGVNLASILLAYYCGIGYGLIGVYLTLVNGLIHIGQGIHLRRYNPGLITSLVLFLPVSGVALWRIIEEAHPPVSFHLLGFASAIIIHLLIVAYVATRFRRA